MDRSGSPAVSIIIPTLNRSEFLEEAIATVRRQTYSDIELIVVDDSEQPTEELLSDADRDRFSGFEYIHGEDHKNSGAARNTGIRSANGELLAFLDDDDLWRPGKIERQVNTFARTDESVGVVYTGQRYVDSEGRTLAVQIPTTKGDVTEDILLGRSINPFSSLMVRSSVVADEHIDERLPFWEDREWLLRLSKRCEFIPIPEPLTIRRMQAHDQLSDDLEARETAYRLFLEKHHEYAASFGPRVERKFLAWLSRVVALSAIQNGSRLRAIEYLGRAIRNDPLDHKSYLYAILALGGRYSYRSAKWLRRTVNDLRYGDTNEGAASRGTYR